MSFSLCNTISNSGNGAGRSLCVTLKRIRMVHFRVSFQPDHAKNDKGQTANTANHMQTTRQPHDEFHKPVIRHHSNLPRFWLLPCAASLSIRNTPSATAHRKNDRKKAKIPTPIILCKVRSNSPSTDTTNSVILTS